MIDLHCHILPALDDGALDLTVRLPSGEVAETAIAGLEDDELRDTTLGAAGAGYCSSRCWAR